MSKETQEKIKEIQAIESKYSLVSFNMALTHLVSAGINNFTDDFVEECKKQILEKEEEYKAQGLVSVMTPEFQFELLDCCVELAKHSPWTIFAYIKRHMVVNI